MVDINKHRFFIVQLLKSIYSDIILGNNLGFKGGTALMLFYDLPRYSIDLDFNLLNPSRSTEVFNRTLDIAAGYGKIKDEAIKHFGMIIVLDYGPGEHNLKIEISGRLVNDSYEVKNYLGIPMQVMQLPDMFSHKLCALTDRKMIANRDIFDCWFLMKRRTPLNQKIIEDRMKTDLHAYLQQCIDRIEQVNEKRILSGLGELMDEEIKKFVRTKLKAETISLLKTYRQFPI
ncbi:MAG: nucleotidyl transferase AbiEii/AbiGii toxin family protein [Marinilabiliales bacterium]|nr:MAG: nucleotidyl transferase AbiEii/AbiGii toxin family protein [Marinilabiliales bacterium]